LRRVRNRDRRKWIGSPNRFRSPGGKEEKVVDEATAVLLGKLPLDSDIQKAKAAFDQAQSVEERFLHDFSG
jgi:hypothetical protein